MLPTKRSSKEKNYLKKIYLIYGEPKAGKTTIASQFGDDKDNKVLFFATEPGHKFQEIYKWKKFNPQTETATEPTTWNHFKECCKELIDNDHDFKMLAIDTADNLWSWCADHVKRQHNIQHESDLGFGKGYTMIKEEFEKPVKALAQRGYGLLFISHAKTNDKELGNKKISYTTSTLSSTAAKIIHGLCDYIFYFHTDTDSKRMIRTKGTEAFNAGDRSGILSELIEMNHETLIKELSKDV